MRTRFSLLVLLLLFATVASAQTFEANLSGASEVPGPGDPDGTGFATITIVGTTVNYTITVNNITLPPSGQHIHVGAAGVSGPILVNLPGTWVGNTLVGSTTAAPATIAAIVANPGGHYVNVHTTDFPAGAVRGQLAAAAPAPAIPAASTLGLLAMAVILAVAGAFLVRRA